MDSKRYIVIISALLFAVALGSIFVLKVLKPSKLPNVRRNAGSPAKWTKYSGNPVLPAGTDTGACFGSVLIVKGSYHMYYSYWTQGIIGRAIRRGIIRGIMCRIGIIRGINIRIGHAISPDGKNWTKDKNNNPVLDIGTDTWENKQVLCPWVWKEGNVWYMIYSGRGSAQESIGLAISGDGTNWTKYSNNPVLVGSGTGWEGKSVENFGVMKINSTTYYLWYESGASGERQIGLATSTNLINWCKDWGWF